MMESDINRIEDKIGQKVIMVARDYGELSWEAAQAGGDYRAIRAAYQKFRGFLQRTERVGLDAAQFNRRGELSNFDILKDADCSVELHKAQGNSLLECRMVRIREGSVGREFLIRLDLTNGQMEESEILEPQLPDLGEACDAK